MPEVITFDFCEITLYENYLVVVMNEGINLTPDHNQVLAELSESHYNGRPFVYITNRVNSYSVDPKIYFETAKIQNLKGFAVVSKNYKAKSNAEIEKMFFNKPFEIFSTLEDAVNWVEDIL